MLKNTIYIADSISYYSQSKKKKTKHWYSIKCQFSSLRAKSFSRYKISHYCCQFTLVTNDLSSKILFTSNRIEQIVGQNFESETSVLYSYLELSISLFVCRLKYNKKLISPTHPPPLECHSLVSGKGGRCNILILLLCTVHLEMPRMVRARWDQLLLGPTPCDAILPTSSSTVQLYFLWPVISAT